MAAKGIVLVAKGLIRFLILACKAAATAFGLIGRLAIIPVARLIGFTAQGPAAGSYASKMMSRASKANSDGGSVRAGSSYSLIQSLMMGGDLASGLTKAIGAIVVLATAVGVGKILIAKQ